MGRALELLIDQPLEPLVIAHALRTLRREARHRRRLRPPVLRRPAVPARAMLLGEHTERGELAECASLLGAVTIEAVAAGEASPDLLERRGLELPHRVAIDATVLVQAASGGGEPLEVDPGGPRSGDIVDVQEQRIAEPPAARVVGAGLERCDRCGG